MPGDWVVIEGPPRAVDVVLETLAMDAVSSHFSFEIREELERVNARMVRLRDGTPDPRPAQDGPTVTERYAMPRASWNMAEETLWMDTDSGLLDNALQDELVDALSTISSHDAPIPDYRSMTPEQLHDLMIEKGPWIPGHMSSLAVLTQTRPAMLSKDEWIEAHLENDAAFAPDRDTQNIARSWLSIGRGEDRVDAEQVEAADELEPFDPDARWDGTQRAQDPKDQFRIRPRRQASSRRAASKRRSRRLGTRRRFAPGPGGLYALTGITANKANAKRNAGIIRDQGWNARVVPVGGGRSWAIYTRHPAGGVAGAARRYGDPGRAVHGGIIHYRRKKDADLAAAGRQWGGLAERNAIEIIGLSVGTAAGFGLGYPIIGAGSGFVASKLARTDPFRPTLKSAATASRRIAQGIERSLERETLTRRYVANSERRQASKDKED